MRVSGSNDDGAQLNFGATNLRPMQDIFLLPPPEQAERFRALFGISTSSTCAWFKSIRWPFLLGLFRRWSTNSIGLTAGGF